MKLKDAQKEVLKSVSKKVGEKLSEDIRQTDPASARRPIVMLILVIAVVGIFRDPTTLLIGIIAAILLAVFMSTSQEDIKAFFAKSEESKEKEEKAKAETDSKGAGEP